MRKWTEVIWFVGAAVWLVAAALSLHLHSRSRTLGALAVAALFLAAGMALGRPGNPPRGRL